MAFAAAYCSRVQVSDTRDDAKRFAARHQKIFATLIGKIFGRLLLR